MIDKESRDKINAMHPREHALARKLLGCDWFDVEGQARRVIESLVSEQDSALSNERVILANRIKQYISKASFSSSSDKHSVLQCVDLLLADTPSVIKDKVQ